jgi:hypothetical protein
VFKSGENWRNSGKERDVFFIKAGWLAASKKSGTRDFVPLFKKRGINSPFIEGNGISSGFVPSFYGDKGKEQRLQKKGCGGMRMGKNLLLIVRNQSLSVESRIHRSGRARCVQGQRDRESETEERKMGEVENTSSWALTLVIPPQPLRVRVVIPPQPLRVRVCTPSNALTSMMPR